MTEEHEVVIQFRNVTKTFDLFKNDKQRLKSLLFHNTNAKKKVAIDNLSFDIRQGKAVAILGKNGAGKSTMLKMISGVTFPTVGSVRVTGRVSALLEVSGGFDPELSGRENIYFRGELLGISREELKEMEPDIVAFSELGSYIDMPIRTYSSGMKSKLGFSINANIRPDIIIVDEALSVGDKDFRAKCRRRIAEILNSGVTFLFVTHSTAEAKKFCKRGLVIHEGKLVFDGDIKDAAAFYEKMHV